MAEDIVDKLQIQDLFFEAEAEESRVMVTKIFDGTPILFECSMEKNGSNYITFRLLNGQKRFPKNLVGKPFKITMTGRYSIISFTKEIIKTEEDSLLIERPQKIQLTQLSDRLKPFYEKDRHYELFFQIPLASIKDCVYQSIILDVSDEWIIIKTVTQKKEFLKPKAKVTFTTSNPIGITPGLQGVIQYSCLNQDGSMRVKIEFSRSLAMIKQLPKDIENKSNKLFGQEDVARQELLKGMGAIEEKEINSFLQLLIKENETFGLTKERRGELFIVLKKRAYPLADHIEENTQKIETLIDESKPIKMAIIMKEETEKIAKSLRISSPNLIENFLKNIPEERREPFKIESAKFYSIDEISSAQDAILELIKKLKS